MQQDARICSGSQDCVQHWQDLSLGPKHLAWEMMSGRQCDTMKRAGFQKEGLAKTQHMAANLTRNTTSSLQQMELSYTTKSIFHSTSNIEPYLFICGDVWVRYILWWAYRQQDPIQLYGQWQFMACWDACSRKKRKCHDSSGKEYMSTFQGWKKELWHRTNPMYYSYDNSYCVVLTLKSLGKVKFRSYTWYHKQNWILDGLIS